MYYSDLSVFPFLPESSLSYIHMVVVVVVVCHDQVRLQVSQDFRCRDS